MRPIRFLGSSLDDLRQFPVDARQEAGYQFVLHCFQKKEQTSQKDISLARMRFRDLMKERT